MSWRSKHRPELARRLVAVVVGSGIAAQRLSPNQAGLQLLENSTATVFGLGALILLFGPVSGAHFNPVVSAADWALGRLAGTGLPGRDVAGYVAAQLIGGIAGAVLANAMFDLAPRQATTKASTGLWRGEIVATAGLIAVIFALARTGRASMSAAIDIMMRSRPAQPAAVASGEPGADRRTGGRITPLAARAQPCIRTRRRSCGSHVDPRGNGVAAAP